MQYLLQQQTPQQFQRSKIEFMAYCSEDDFEFHYHLWKRTMTMTIKQWLYSFEPTPDLEDDYNNALIRVHEYERMLAANKTTKPQ
jgi:hypothetical protein